MRTLTNFHAFVAGIQGLTAERKFIVETRDIGLKLIMQQVKAYQPELSKCQPWGKHSLCHFL